MEKVFHPKVDFMPGNLRPIQTLPAAKIHLSQAGIKDQLGLGMSVAKLPCQGVTAL
jgi:hypothetical protein